LAEQAVFASPEKLAKQYRRLPAASAVAAADAKKAPRSVVPSVAQTAAPPAAAATPTPSLAAGETKQQIVPRLTGEITRAMLLKNSAPKTAEMPPPMRETDPIALPQPRFDSL
jgi:hypothetical protein